MIASTRPVVQIDSERCNGCGLCMDACAEAAIELVDGKARLVSDLYCDGLGACLGDCPQGAMTIVERMADAFDAEAVERRIAESAPTKKITETQVGQPSVKAQNRLSVKHAGCPSSALQTFAAAGGRSAPRDAEGADSELSQWPVQLRLVPPVAPFLKGRELVIAADCVAYAYAGFHAEFLKDRSLLIACPKLDDPVERDSKLEAIFRFSGATAVKVVTMQVPCCGGLVRAVQTAAANSGTDLPVETVVIGIQGNRLP